METKEKVVKLARPAIAKVSFPVISPLPLKRESLTFCELKIPFVKRRPCESRISVERLNLTRGSHNASRRLSQEPQCCVFVFVNRAHSDIACVEIPEANAMKCSLMQGFLKYRLVNTARPLDPLTDVVPNTVPQNAEIITAARTRLDYPKSQLFRPLAERRKPPG